MSMLHKIWLRIFPKYVLLLTTISGEVICPFNNMNYIYTDTHFYYWPLWFLRAFLFLDAECGKVDGEVTEGCSSMCVNKWVTTYMENRQGNCFFEAYDLLLVFLCLWVLSCNAQCCFYMLLCARLWVVQCKSSCFLMICSLCWLLIWELYFLIIFGPSTCHFGYFKFPKPTRTLETVRFQDPK